MRLRNLESDDRHINGPFHYGPFTSKAGAWILTVHSRLSAANDKCFCLCATKSPGSPLPPAPTSPPGPNLLQLGSKALCTLPYPCGHALPNAVLPLRI